MLCQGKLIQGEGLARIDKIGKKVQRPKGRLLKKFRRMLFQNNNTTVATVKFKTAIITCLLLTEITFDFLLKIITLITKFNQTYFTNEKTFLTD